MLWLCADSFRIGWVPNSPANCGMTRSSGSMLNSGDVVDLDLGVPSGREVGLRRPAVVVKAERILEAGPSVIHVVPLTTATRGSLSDPTRGQGWRESLLPSVSTSDRCR